MLWVSILSLLIMWCTGLNSQPVMSQPPSATVSPGNTVKLSCVMSSGFQISAHDTYWYQQKLGNPPRFLLYYYSDSSKRQGPGVPSRFSGSKDASSNTGYLTITGALAEDEADYYCATWHSGADSRFALTRPPSAPVPAGNTAKLSFVMASGYSISAYYMDWYQQKPGDPPRYLLCYYSDSNQQQGSGVPSHFSASKDTSSNTFYLKYQISPAMFWASIVSLLVAWCTGSYSQAVVSQPPSASVSLGSTVKLPCTAVRGHHVHWFQQKPGNPPSYLLYYKSDSDKGQGSGVPSRFSGSKDASGNTGYLTISGVLAEDEANYYCGRGDGDSFAQWVLTQPPSVSVSLDQNAQITCSGNIIEDYSVQWYQQKPGMAPVLNHYGIHQRWWSGNQPHHPPPNCWPTHLAAHWPTCGIRL
ncbi:UNVERIFIED_CONTAM: hypothetical protein K2H54_021687 [Gekko kuhli]